MHIYVAKKSFLPYGDRRHLPQNSFESRRGGLYIYETFQRGIDQKKEDYFKQPITITRKAVKIVDSEMEAEFSVPLQR
jgi:hypothetical protein